MKRSGLFLPVVVSLLWWSVSFCSPIFAADSIGLVPAHPNINDKNSFSAFRYEMEIGETKSGEIAVANLSSEEASVNLSLIEGESGWVTIASGSAMTVAAGERENGRFSVTVPAKAKTGEHRFVIGSDRGGSVALVIFVKGEAKKDLVVGKMELSSQKERLLMGATIVNRGNLTVDSFSLRVNLLNKWGVGSIKLASFLYPVNQRIAPGEEVSIKILSDNKLPFWGKYDTTYNLEFTGGGQTGVGESFAFVSPVRTVTYVAMAVVVLAAFVIFSVRLAVVGWRLVLRVLGYGQEEKSPAEAALVTNVTRKVEESDLAAVGENKEELLLAIRKIIREEMEMSGIVEKRGPGRPKTRRNRVYVMR